MNEEAQQHKLNSNPERKAEAAEYEREKQKQSEPVMLNSLARPDKLRELFVACSDLLV